MFKYQELTKIGGIDQTNLTVDADNVDTVCNPERLRQELVKWGSGRANSGA